MGMCGPVSVVQVTAVGGTGGLRARMLMVVRTVVTMRPRVVVRMAVHGPIRVPVFVLMRVVVFVRCTVPVLTRVVVRMDVHGAVRVPVLVGVRVFMGVVMASPVTVFRRVVVRMAVFGTVGVAVRVRVLVQVIVRRAVPVFVVMVVRMHMQRAVGVAMHMLVVMMVLVPMLVPMLVPVFVRMPVHRAIGVPMFVPVGAHRAALYPGFTFSTTAYRAHLQPPETLFRCRRAGLKPHADATHVGTAQPLCDPAPFRSLNHNPNRLLRPCAGSRSGSPTPF